MSETIVSGEVDQVGAQSQPVKKSVEETQEKYGVVASIAQSLTESFKSLNLSRVKYAVLENFEGIPFSPAKRLVILLTSDPDAVVRLLQLEHLDGYVYRRRFGGDAESEKYFNVKVIRKGAGFLPDRFESELLARTEEYEQLVRIPQMDLLARSILYRKLFHEEWLADEPEARRIMKNYVETTVGPGTPSRLPAKVSRGKF